MGWSLLGGLMAATGHVTSRDGTRIGYERSGAGPALVLVHGTTADRTRRVPVLPTFEEHFTVYAMDRRGRGLSGDTEPYAIEREYEDIAALVDAIEGPAHVLGHSYGALCALEAALLTSNVARLVLYEPAFPTGEPLYPPGRRELFEAMLARGDREAVLATFFREDVGLTGAELEAARAEPSWAARLTSAHTLPREFADGDYVFDPRPFEALAVPVLLLTGSESPSVLTAPTAALHAALPQSRVGVMEGQSHAAITMAPELFARLVVDFLTET